jgi:hypothetical protein
MKYKIQESTCNFFIMALQISEPHRNEQGSMKRDIFYLIAKTSHEETFQGNNTPGTMSKLLH